MIVKIKRMVLRYWPLNFSIFSIFFLFLYLSDYNLKKKRMISMRNRAISNGFNEDSSQTRVFSSNNFSVVSNKVNSKKISSATVADFRHKNPVTSKTSLDHFSSSINHLETEEEFMKRMEKRMKRRKKHLKNTCRAFGLNYENKTFDAWSLKIPVPKPWMFVSEKYKLIYTEIPKSGSSNWKKVMMVLNGLVNTTANITQNQAHVTKIGTIHRGYNLPDELLKIYQQSTKLIVVRDPLERIASAYLDKVMKNATSNSSVFDKFSWEVAKKYGKRVKNQTKFLRNGAKEVTACQDFVAELSCSSTDDVIKIISATYGGSENASESCALDEKWNDSSCVTPLASFIASQICSGKKVCDVIASDVLFGRVRNCDSVKKVLKINYVCTHISNWNLITVCSGFSHIIQCPHGGVISVARALFGRKNRKTCSFRSIIKDTNCEATTATSAVISACNNKQSCVVLANSTWIQSDSCPTTNKYLQVWYTCVGKEMSINNGIPIEIDDDSEKKYDDKKDSHDEDYDDDQNNNFDADDRKFYKNELKEMRLRKLLTESKEVSFELKGLQSFINTTIPIIYSPHAVDRKYSLSATFQEFVAYLLDLKNGDVTKDVIDHGSAVLKSTSVRHWQTYYRLTYPCYINYDVIAHMETIDEDARYLLNRIGAPKDLHYPRGYNQKSGKSATSKEKVQKLISTLNLTTIQKLINLYLIDYKLFDYKVPDFR